MSHADLHSPAAPAASPPVGAQPQSFLEFTEQEQSFFSVGQEKADAAEPTYLEDSRAPALKAIPFGKAAALVRDAALKAARIAKTLPGPRSLPLPSRRSLGRAAVMCGLVLAVAGSLRAARGGHDQQASDVPATAEAGHPVAYGPPAPARAAHKAAAKGKTIAGTRGHVRTPVKLAMVSKSKAVKAKVRHVAKVRPPVRRARG